MYCLLEATLADHAGDRLQHRDQDAIAGVLDAGVGVDRAGHRLEVGLRAPFGGEADQIGNIGIEDVPVPEPGPAEVLIRVCRSLISRGSEIGRRYLAEEALEHGIMGYSAAGEVVAAGSAIDGFSPGQRVVAASPHADYVVADPSLGDNSWILSSPDDLSLWRPRPSRALGSCSTAPSPG
jgi:hypothetical protein